MTAQRNQDYLQVLTRIERNLASDVVWLPTEFVQETDKNGRTHVKGVRNIIAGENKITMAVSHETKNVISYRNGKKVMFTETIHKGESNFKKQQDIARKGEYVDESRPGAANVMNVHIDFDADKREVIPIEELPPTIQSYGRVVRRNRSDVDKWDSILSKAIAKARPIIRKNQNSALQTGSGATESIVNVKARDEAGIAKEQGRALS